MSRRNREAEDAARIKQQEQAQAEIDKQLFQRRVGLVKEGAKAAAMKRFSEAASKFHTFLRTMEQHKGLSEGTLSPSSFDAKKEFPDYVLTTEVYWELCKIYDRIKNPDGKNKSKSNPELQKYLDKYISFAKGVSFEKRFEKLCGERLRKFIQNEKPINREIFKASYFKMTGSKCFIATAVMDELRPDVFIGLRVFRDRKLKKTRLGRVFISFYYFFGPYAAKLILISPEVFRRLCARFLEKLYDLKVFQK